MTQAANERIAQILLVEDNPGDICLVREALRQSTMRSNLHTAEDGDAALAFLRRQGPHAAAPRPDLILLDLNLPRKDGREVLGEVKGDPALRAIPVVVLTTSEADQDVLRAYDLHANCYLTKPVDFSQFEHVVRTVEAFWLSLVKLPPQAA